jgi:hypothetical protein
MSAFEYPVVELEDPVEGGEARERVTPTRLQRPQETDIRLKVKGGGQSQARPRLSGPISV